MLTENDNLEEWLQSLTDVAYQRYQVGDISGLAKAISKFEPLYNWYQDDPAQSAIETASMNCILMLAESYAISLNFEQALGHCKNVYNLLEENRARFIALGNNPRPNSLIWCELLGTMAFVKWKTPIQFKNAVMPPSQMIQKYMDIDTLIHLALKDIPYKDESKNESMVRTALACGLEIVKLASRYIPGQLTRLLEFIGKNHGAAFEDPGQPYFWNLRIAQIWCNGNPDRELLEDCFEGYERTMVGFWDENPFLSVFLKSLQLEKDYLLMNPSQNQ